MIVSRLQYLKRRAAENVCAWTWLVFIPVTSERKADYYQCVLDMYICMHILKGLRENGLELIGLKKTIYDCRQKLDHLSNL